MASFATSRRERNQDGLLPFSPTNKLLHASNHQRPALDRTLSSPPTSPTSTVKDANPQFPYETPKKSIVSQLTPPTSPLSSKSSSDLPSIMDQVYADASPENASTRRSHSSFTNNGGSLDELPALPELMECPFDVQIVNDSSGRPQVFGRGAWSTVYRAIGHERMALRSNTLPTPPSSPTVSVPLIVAVKTPARRDARPIIRNEGIVLTHIVRTESSARFVVPFYGFSPHTESLVLEPIPLSLHDYIQECTNQANPITSSWPSSEPIVGSISLWIRLAEHSIRALAWLHTEAGGQGVVHGDIKPSNILLAPKFHTDSEFAFTPLLADFSSSQLLSSSVISPNTLSAVTREYTAPELLSYQVLSNPNSVATTASDVFSLAVTLLVAATGDLMVYPGSVFQRQAMATQGWNVINNVRNGDQGSRVPMHGLVDRVLERAVLRAGMGRMDATSWCRLIEEIGIGEPIKKS